MINPDIFRLPEILEAALLRVPPVIVQTTCRQVCRHWKEMIETTPALKHYTRTGLWLPDREDGPRQALVEPRSAFTPMAFDVLQLFWRKLDRHSLKNQDIRVLEISDREPLLTHIGKLLSEFTPICNRVELLRPGLSSLKYGRFKKNWVTVVHRADEVGRVQELFTKGVEINPLTKIVEQLAHDVWNSTTCAEFDYNPDGVVPRHENGNIKAYFLFIVEYTVDKQEQQEEERKRKEKDEVMRQKDRKEVKMMIENRRRERGEPEDADETEENEDEWEEEERKKHEVYEGFIGKKVFKELMRLGDYEPYRPMVVIRGTNYGYI
ncbi:hypothetical protein ABW20_dc0100860 [Dactylellina cionopaga]|nr:hypothetical protein ABW20_dc0100860 [Dactylellina cionopaga]